MNVWCEVVPYPISVDRYQHLPNISGQISTEMLKNPKLIDQVESKASYFCHGVAQTHPQNSKTQFFERVAITVEIMKIEALTRFGIEEIESKLGAKAEALENKIVNAMKIEPGLTDPTPELNPSRPQDIVYQVQGKVKFVIRYDMQKGEYALSEEFFSVNHEIVGYINHKALAKVQYS